MAFFDLSLKELQTYKPDQIVTTQIVRDECQTHQSMFIDLGEATLKGFDELVRVHEVKWEDT